MIWLIFLRELKLAFIHEGTTWKMLGLTMFLLLFIAVSSDSFAFYAYAILGVDNLALYAYFPRHAGLALTLAMLLTVPCLLENDATDGTLEQYLLQPFRLEALVAMKLFAFWLSTILPACLALYWLARISGLSNDTESAGLLLALLLATPSLVILCALGGAITLGWGALVQSLVIVPLCIPVVYCVALTSYLPASFALLATLLLFIPATGCVAIAKILRHHY